MKFSLSVPPTFDFWRTVYSHGWCALPPFSVLKDDAKFQRVFTLAPRRSFVGTMRPTQPRRLEIHLDITQPLSVHDKIDLKRQITASLRLDEDFSEFYREARRHAEFRWIARAGAGRMLRSPTVFEDVVKMMCTTNCSWALTEIMVQNLCVKFGKPVRDGLRSFPAPDAIADSTERFLRKEIHAGYRSPFLFEFARRVASGKLHVEEWRSSNALTPELFMEILSVKGIGPYAAGNILKLLGRYDYLGIDSWSRKKFFEIHKNGRTTSDKVIERFYGPFGKWRGLFFWLDVTKHWYNQKFPF